MAWQELKKTWHDTNVDYCDVCGNLLIQRAWVFTGDDGATLRACREDDERLYAALKTYEPLVEEARRAFEARTAGAGSTE